MAMSSTACVLQLLKDRAELDGIHGRGGISDARLVVIALPEHNTTRQLVSRGWTSRNVFWMSARGKKQIHDLT